MAQLKLLPFYFLLFGLSGCFVADEFFLDEGKGEDNLQSKSERAVVEFLTDQFDSNYKGYGFSDIIIVKPRTIQIRDSLKVLYRQEQTEELKSEILRLNDTIKKYNYENEVKLSHFYLVEGESNFQVMETEFTLSDTLTVKKNNAKLFAEFPSEKKKYVYNFFYETAIFITPSYYESAKMSQNFYNFYKTKLESFNLLTTKSDFYKHCIFVTETVTREGDYDPQNIAVLSSQHNIIKLNNPYYKPLSWTVLNEVTSDENGLLGYFFFHTFIPDTLLAPQDTMKFQFEFSPYLQITSKTDVTNL